MGTGPGLFSISFGEDGPLGFYGMGVSQGLLFFLIEKPKKKPKASAAG